jgi:hypothetical protein
LAVARFRLDFVFATVVLLFAGLPGAHEIIMGVGFLRFAELFRLRGAERGLCLGALRLARNAAFWRFVPKIRICFALILRRAFAIVFFLPPARAGF